MYKCKMIVVVSKTTHISQYEDILIKYKLYTLKAVIYQLHRYTVRTLITYIQNGNKYKTIFNNFIKIG